MSVSKREFGVSPAGEKVTLFTITNKAGMSVEVTNYGAILVSVTVPDAQGKMEDVVLGYDTVEGYYQNSSFFGATIGPNANRIGGAAFALDGQTYQLKKNDGTNNLHSDENMGYHKQVWKASEGTDRVLFTLEEADGAMGFPGNKTISLTYVLTEDNRLELHYHGESDKNTIINMTNHSYFNLEGQGNGDIESHELWMKASRYTPVVAGAIPTGELAPVAGTPMDFTESCPVGKRIRDDFEQLKLTLGYDHNWVIDGWDGSLQLFAQVKAPVSKRVMKVYTNLPGVQFYAGNCIQPENGKKGAAYKARSGMCLETQFFPDTANKQEFPSAVFGPERFYDYTTVYAFEVEK